MASLSVPSAGIVVRLDANGEKVLKDDVQSMRLDLAQDSIKDILKTLRNNQQVRIRLGKKPALQYGKTSLALNHRPAEFPSELFSRPGNEAGDLYFSGKLGHRLEVRKAQEATASTDQALAALESTLKSIQEQKASNETSFVRNKDEMKELKRKGRPSPLFSSQAPAIRQDRFMSGITRSTPSSPFLGSSFSPRQGPTSAPLQVSGLSNKDKVRLDAIRIPMVHLLAVRPLTTKSLAQTLRTSIEDCEKVLLKISRDSMKLVGRKELKDKAYRELNPWKFPYSSDDDRQAAIGHAVQAFDRMRIERTDLSWQLLLPQEERGKGKHLSKLNFVRPVPLAKISTPRLDAQGSEEVVSSGDLERVQDRGRLSVNEPTRSKARSHEPVQRKKVSEKETSSKEHVRKEAFTQLKEIYHDRQRKHEKPVAASSKYRSPEIVEDSDEGAEAAKDALAKPKTLPSKDKNLLNPQPSRPHSPKPSTSPLSTKIQQKSKLSTTSSASASANDDLGNSNLSDESTLKSRPRAESSLSRISPRPRTDSSPPKPSPLASSPPTNSSDLDNTSSSKASSRSSATSSPPSSTDMPQKKPKHFSPVVADNKDTPIRGRSPAKRSADDADDQPPRKRQQVNGVNPDVPPTVTTDTSQRPSAKRHLSDSSSSLSPEKPEQKIEEVIDKSKRFQLYYKRYKDFHEKLSASTKRDEQEVQELWRMHKRMTELKEEIWGDWRRLGRPENIEI